MKLDDPTMRAIVRRSMVARIATLSRNGRPAVTPIYFVYARGSIWLGTVDWTLAVRNVRADPRVSILFELEQNSAERRVVRIRGRASLRTEQEIVRFYNLRVAFKYLLTPAGIHHLLLHTQLMPLRRAYHALSKEKGQACIIAVDPEEVEWLPGELSDRPS